MGMKEILQGEREKFNMLSIWALNIEPNKCIMKYMGQ
jgi:hypothetical protein